MASPDKPKEYTICGIKVKASACQWMKQVDVSRLAIHMPYHDNGEQILLAIIQKMDLLHGIVDPRGSNFGPILIRNGEIGYNTAVRMNPDSIDAVLNRLQEEFKDKQPEALIDRHLRRKAERKIAPVLDSVMENFHEAALHFGWSVPEMQTLKELVSFGLVTYELKQQGH